MFVIFFHIILRQRKNRSASHDTQVRSRLRERCKSACLQHVLSYCDLRVHMCAMVPFHVEEALETDTGELCKKKHQASFLPSGHGAAEPRGGDAAVWVTGVQGCSGWGWFGSHPCRREGMYLWEFNATPASLSLSENSCAVLTTKLSQGSVRVSFRSALQWVKCNDAHLIPISSFTVGLGGWELTAIYIPHLRQFGCLFKPPLNCFHAKWPRKNIAMCYKRAKKKLNVLGSKITCPLDINWKSIIVKPFFVSFYKQRDIERWFSVLTIQSMPQVFLIELNLYWTQFSKQLNK